MSTVKGDNKDDGKFKIDDKEESFALREDIAVLDIQVLFFTFPLHASIVFSSGPENGDLMVLETDNLADHLGH